MKIALTRERMHSRIIINERAYNQYEFTYGGLGFVGCQVRITSAMYFSLSIKYEWKQRDSMQLFNFEYFYSEKRKTFDLIFFFSQFVQLLFWRIEIE